ncbi:hydroxymethylbilane synthase [Cellulosilyticum ruminicola]|uniref:hydroxymethylbilane synthase n=1 Tax=Cellulosilyticum ruminicola TaxID=425254 RepID=UPI0006D27BAD|nr:hydroxymethylbilane synthase [Cellulosilyticum ruminicola]
MKVKVGTRGSKLALTQTNWVVDQLRAHNPGVEFEVEIIKTKGDMIQNIPLDKIGDKGLFTKEIELKLLDGSIDLAVHSMKDMPSKLPEGLKFSYTPPREDMRDALVLKEGYSTLADLPQGATIGTGSKRRKYQLLALRPDLNIVPIRGNVDTRIRKIETENLHGVVLAAAGLKRVGLKDKISCYLLPEKVIPAPAQGILAIEVRKNDAHIDELMKSIYDEAAKIQMEAERSFLDTLEGSCHIPVGAYCKVEGENITLTGLYGDEEGTILIKKSLTGHKDEAVLIGKKLAEEVREAFKNEKG